jgi:hypothetical protein
MRGKLFRKSMETNVQSVAKLRLADFTKGRQEEMGGVSAVKTGRRVVADCITLFRQRLDGESTGIGSRMRFTFIRPWSGTSYSPTVLRA